MCCSCQQHECVVLLMLACCYGYRFLQLEVSERASPEQKHVCSIHVPLHDVLQLCSSAYAAIGCIHVRIADSRMLDTHCFTSPQVVFSSTHNNAVVCIRRLAQASILNPPNPRSNLSLTSTWCASQQAQQYSTIGLPSFGAIDSVGSDGTPKLHGRGQLRICVS